MFRIWGKVKAFSPQQITNPHSALRGPECVYVKMDMWAPFASTTYNLLFCVSFLVCVCVCVWLRHSSSRNPRRCDLRDTGFCSFWGLRGAEVSEFQFPSKSHSQLHTRTNTLLPLLLSPRALSFSSHHSFRYKHTPLHSKEKSCLTPLDPTATTPPHISSNKHPYLVFTPSFQAKQNWGER